ncbi:class II fructose-bisphosphatase [Bacillus methanolicus]|uniref:Fructose-1,6-bisphosphatase n=1 Tax=Bacillus methanolicus (strain MGA3 / ATCC 53907) TaxID=796606 RepID=Q6TV42_BACMM|nr:class II fructose-bisphosphatase [Bacillus methanolicus]AAR39404.1 putative class II fructose-1,6-bisphosphatase / seduheptulose-1,7-bisphosphatase [Bacillus methanolicus MGA3]AIE61789.1 Fructose-1,6-bisphosphatase class 2 [Bacillus methanolicus MGA3]EIJ77594.1 fructose bisphosphatase [Bacillus methanolicus MGA3]
MRELKSEKRVQSLAMEFLSVAQQAALASYPWIGKGNKNEVDRAGTEAMRNRLNLIDMSGLIVIGEGEMDEAPMLYIGEELGTGKGPQLDIAVDPVDGTGLMAKGMDNSIAVIAASTRGSLLHAPDMYMEKIAVGPKAKGCVNLDASLTENMKSVAKALGKDLRELTVMIQDRPRHDHLIQQVRDVGARLKLFSDGDVTRAIGTALEEVDVDILVGTGGAPEGVIAATALKCLGGDFQGRLAPQNEEEFDRCITMGITDPRKIFTIDEIVKSDDCFFVATGITDGLLINGIRKKEDGLMQTHSFLTIGGSSVKYQFIEAYH